jgi:enediyne biosynthesis protein E4
VGKYTSDEQGPDSEFLGLADAFHGHLHPDRFEYPVLYKNLGNDKFKDVTAEVGLKPVGWCGDASFADLTGNGYPDLYLLNMQGQNHYFQNERGQKFVDKTDEYFPKTPWGAMGIKFFDYDNDGRMDLLVTDMHSDMFQEVGPDKEKLKNTGHASEKMLGAPATIWAAGNLRKFRIAWTLKIIGRGG